MRKLHFFKDQDGAVWFLVHGDEMDAHGPADQSPVPADAVTGWYDATGQPVEGDIDDEVE